MSGGPFKTLAIQECLINAVTGQVGTSTEVSGKATYRELGGSQVEVG
jgi:hypothetical protein